MNEETKTIEIRCRFCGVKTAEVSHLDERARALNLIDTLSGEITNCNEAIGHAERSDEPEETKKEIIDSCISEIAKREVLIPQLQTIAENTPPWEERPESNIENYGVEDARCEKCREEKGNYPDMRYEALSKGLTQEEFEAIMKKTKYTDKGFSELVDKKVEDKNKNRPVDKDFKITNQKVDDAGNITDCVDCSNK